MTGRIDLHTHSTASDGSFTPAELVQEARRLGLKGLALTDHDTAGGNPEAMAEAARQGIRFVPGIEISCDYQDKAIHILGYWIDFRNSTLNETLKQVIDYRNRRNLILTERLRELGISMIYEEVAQVAGNEVVGRPHFAAVLVKKRVVSNFREAFDKYLGKGGLAYIPKRRLTAAEGLQLIKTVEHL